MHEISYLETTKDVYKNAANSPDKGLCCTTSPIWQLPELTIPQIMLEMNYGFGTTIHPRDLVNHPTVLYVGVGGGMELLLFAYFSRKSAGVVGIAGVIFAVYLKAPPIPKVIRSDSSSENAADILKVYVGSSGIIYNPNPYPECQVFESSPN
jgi:hypothetical protein